jgi:hypothetical protein
MKQTKTIVVLLLVLLGLFYLFLSKQDKWTLSLYKDGETVSRTILNSLDSCSTAGAGYVSQGSVDRFDCGLNCEKSDTLSQGVICMKVVR